VITTVILLPGLWQGFVRIARGPRFREIGFVVVPQPQVQFVAAAEASGGTRGLALQPWQLAGTAIPLADRGDFVV